MTPVVIDASALARAVLDPTAGALLEELAAAHVHAPHLVDVEVLSVARREVRAGAITAAAAGAALPRMGDVVDTRHDHRPLQDRALALRDNLSAYDAVYVALAEALDARLLTLDARLVNAPGSRCRIQLARDL